MGPFGGSAGGSGTLSVPRTAALPGDEYTGLGRESRPTGSWPRRKTTGTQESYSSLSVKVSHVLIALAIPSNRYLVLITWIIVYYFSVSLLTIDFCLFLVLGIKPGPHACRASALSLSDLSSSQFHLVFNKFIFSLSNIIKALT